MSFIASDLNTKRKERSLLSIGYHSGGGGVEYRILLRIVWEEDWISSITEYEYLTVKVPFSDC